MKPANLQIRYVNSLEPAPTADAVSMTANIGVFSPLTAVVFAYGYPRQVMTQASEVCNNPPARSEQHHEESGRENPGSHSHSHCEIKFRCSSDMTEHSFKQFKTRL